MGLGMGPPSSLLRVGMGRPNIVCQLGEAALISPRNPHPRGGAQAEKPRSRERRKEREKARGEEERKEARRKTRASGPAEPPKRVSGISLPRHMAYMASVFQRQHFSWSARARQGTRETALPKWVHFMSYTPGQATIADMVVLAFKSTIPRPETLPSFARESATSCGSDLETPLLLRNSCGACASQRHR